MAQIPPQVTDFSAATNPASVAEGAGVGGGTSAPASAAPAAPQVPATQLNALLVQREESGDGSTQARDNQAGALAVQIADLEEDLQDAMHRLDELNDTQSDIRTAVAGARQKVDELTLALEKLRPAPTLNDHLRHYQESQAKIRAQRATNLKALNSVGGLADILKSLKSPVDAAMSRKTARGNRRPNFTGETK